MWYYIWVNRYDLSHEQLERLAGASDGLLARLANTWAFTQRPGQAYRCCGEFVTVMLGGRGSGKTLPGTHAIHSLALDPDDCGGYAGVVARTPVDLKRYNLFGDSGILTWAQRDPGCLTPRWHRQDGILEFPSPRGLTNDSGLVVYLYSSRNPDQLHSANLGFAWGDELRNWVMLESTEGAYRGLMQCVRIGPRPRILLTTTPSERAAEILRRIEHMARRPMCEACGEELEDMPPVRVDPRFSLRTTEPRRTCACGAEVIASHRMIGLSTRDNLENVNRGWLARLEAELTPIERLAIVEGRLVDYNPHRLWSGKWPRRVARIPGGLAGSPEERLRAVLGLVRIVVGVDPSGVDDPEDGAADPDDPPEVGIVVLGQDAGGACYVLEDLSGEHSGDTWGEVVSEAAARWHATVIAEANYGRGMVRQVIKSAAIMAGRAEPEIILVTVSRDKAHRARPVAAAYRAGRVVHVLRFAGDPGLELLEVRLARFNPRRPKARRTDRMDALGIAWHHMNPDDPEADEEHTAAGQFARNNLL